MTDFRGKEIKVGDKIVTTPPFNSKLIVGEVKQIEPKWALIEIDHITIYRTSKDIMVLNDEL